MIEVNKKLVAEIHRLRGRLSHYEALEAWEDPVFSDQFYEQLEKKFHKLYDEITEIAMYSTSRPRELGEGDDGDGHYKRIAYALINRAAIARRMVR